jgi:hypothetical protein
MYAVFVLDSWNIHPDSTEQQTENTDPSECPCYLQEAKDWWFENFELFPNDRQKMYKDNDSCLNSATKSMLEYQLLPNQSVRIYANCLKGNWRRAGGNLITHEVIVCDIAWVGLPHTLKMKVSPWISSSNDRFNTIDQLFDCAAASVFQPDIKMP